MQYYFSLGANIGEREQTIQQALQIMEVSIGHIQRCSSFYYSEPWGFESEHPFCNLCCRIETSLSPVEVLHSTQAIERALGRMHKSRDGQYSDRSIDIDIIRIFDGAKEISITTPELTIPHPLWTQREFVKVPLREIMQ